MVADLKVDTTRITGFCRANRIAKLSVFGSALSKALRPDSDIDILVQFEPGREPGLLALARMQRELSAMFGRQVDLRTPEDLSRHFRDEVMARAEVLYAA